MKHFSEAHKKKFLIVPRFTTVYHPIRTKLDLSVTEYSVVDSIDHMSHSYKYPWCKESKEKIGAFLGISRRTVFRAIDVGLEKGLLEKNEDGHLRSSEKWIETVRLYKAKIGKE